MSREANSDFNVSGDEVQAALDQTQRAKLDSARHVARWLGLFAPLALTLVGTLITASWVPRMPDPMAVHWGSDFMPDAYGPPWSNVAMSLGTGLLLTAMYFLQGLQSAKPGAAQWGPMHRLLPSLILGTVVFLQVAAVGTAWLQLDAVDASSTPGTGWVLLLGFSLWIVVGLAAYLGQPRLRIDAPASALALPMTIEPSERVVWFGEARAAAAFFWVTVPAMLLLFAGTILVFAVGNEPLAAWVMLGATLLVSILFVTNSWFRVRIDSTGLTARSVLGWPVYRVAASDVKSVKAVQINPFAEYGGWGARLSPTGFGLVLRAGEGIVIERQSRARTFAITIDEAADAASLLAAVAKSAARNQSN